MHVPMGKGLGAIARMWKSQVSLQKFCFHRYAKAVCSQSRRCSPELSSHLEAMNLRTRRPSHFLSREQTLSSLKCCWVYRNAEYKSFNVIEGPTFQRFQRTAWEATQCVKEYRFLKGDTERMLS